MGPALFEADATLTQRLSRDQKQKGLDQRTPNAAGISRRGRDTLPELRLSFPAGITPLLLPKLHFCVLAFPPVRRCYSFPAFSKLFLSLSVSFSFAAGR